ncbi:putative candidate secreted effector protein [Blumeria hordei DH14]|uniref:Putative candidate secreted effector protein n=1 Tax=Blumeria graminis f. sp. hordei (strain DH14) TaxID=546991 RepID=N1JK03_BLUG1|nr:putative candidate secreted effector protein [Blumeria hordei DH14]
MRLTSLVVILQSASFFVTIFATFTTSHINEEAKRFDCEDRQFLPEEYKRIENIGINRFNKSDYRICAFKDENDAYYRFFELADSGQSERLDSGCPVHTYILVTDHYDRANAVIKRKTIYEGQRSPKVTYSICEIR